MSAMLPTPGQWYRSASGTDAPKLSASGEYLLIEDTTFLDYSHHGAGLIW